MSETPKKTDHLQGVTLENLLNQLVDAWGWERLADLIRINCFTANPSIKSSLTFLRRTPWARSQVEVVFIGFKENESEAQIRQRLKALGGKPQPAKPAGKSGGYAQKPAKPGLQQQNRSAKKSVDPWAKAKAGQQDQ